MTWTNWLPCGVSSNFRRIRFPKYRPAQLSRVQKYRPSLVRQSSYREDVLRLITYWGGQRVHGSDSYGARFYLDANGELQYSYAEDAFLEGVDRSGRPVLRRSDSF